MPQIIKEIRVLIPPLAVLLLSGLLPYRFFEAKWLYAFLGLFVLCSVVMAALSFGHEFQQRTISLLLSQPLPRKAIWLKKTVLLAIFLAMAALVVVPKLKAFLLFNLVAADYYAEPRIHSIWLAFIAVSLIAFCTVPFLTLVFRSTLLGVVFSLLIAGAVMSVNGLFGEYVLRNREATILSGYIFLGIYAVTSSFLGYRKFMKLQAIEGSAFGGEIELPHGIKKACAAAMEVLWGTFKGPTAALIKKELRLQQVPFFLTAIFCILAVLGAILYLAQRGNGQQTNSGEVLLSADFIIYAVLLPLLVGSLSLAEEKTWGVAEWQHMLPVSLLKQWGMKMLVTFCTAVFLGFILPLSMLLLGQIWLGPSQSANSFSEWGVIQVLGYLVLVQLIIFASSISANTVRSILTGLGLLGLIGCAIGATYWAFQHYEIFEDYLTYGRYAFEADDGQKAGGRWMLFTLEMAVCFGLLQRFSFYGFRTMRSNPARVALQFGIIFLVACLMTFTALALGQ